MKRYIKAQTYELQDSSGDRATVERTNEDAATLEGLSPHTVGLVFL